jgi:hypothetical protein
MYFPKKYYLNNLNLGKKSFDFLAVSSQPMLMTSSIYFLYFSIMYDWSWCARIKSITQWFNSVLKAIDFHQTNRDQSYILILK